MKKDFGKWNIKKKEINNKKSAAFCHQREIWWCSLGANIGFEQDGTGKNFDRPVLVVRGFNENVFFGAALTSNRKTGKFYFPVGKIEDREAFVILSQVRLFDTKRLIRKVGIIDKDLFEKLKNALKKALFND